MDQFVFLFPDKWNIDKDLIKNNPPWGVFGRFTEYSRLLDQCIELRYRSKGFGINHVLLKGESISSLVKLNDSDNIFYANISREDMNIACKANKDYHADSEQIISQLGLTPDDELIIGGFHLRDCVSRLAKDAYNKGINVLVDEDLTETFLHRSKSSDFRIGVSNSFNPLEKSLQFYNYCVKANEGKPWMYQYPPLTLQLED